MAKVSEIFWSAQGEGLNSGVPAVFVRLAGCSLRCPYCDTRRSWSGGRDMDTAAVVAEVQRWLAAYPRSILVLTGGEPLEQDLGTLLKALKGKKRFVAVETNGLHFQELPFDWWTVSPKDVSGFRVHPRLWSRASEVKLLATPELTLDVVAAMRRRTRAPIVLQPEHGRPQKHRRAFDLFRSCQARGIAGVRLGAQLQRIFRVR
jgi:organic radical activating enzyme